MKIEIVQKKENPLQKRVEVYFNMDHNGEPTPKRNVVTEEFIKQMKSNKDCIIIDSIRSMYGHGMSKGYAKIYQIKEAALEFDRKHLLKRNGIELEKTRSLEG